MKSAVPATSGSGSPRFDRTSAAILDAAARVFSEEGASANLASVAAAAGVSRATLYRYYANREALLDALAADALADVTRRLADAGLQRATVEGAIERIVRAFVAVGDRYAVLLGDHERLSTTLPRLAAPVHDVLARGIDNGVLRSDLSIGTLSEFLTGVALSAIKLIRQQQLGLEEASAAAASLFLDGSRPRPPVAR
jgi:AcrR family transcriptional regulator